MGGGEKRAAYRIAEEMMIQCNGRDGSCNVKRWAVSNPKVEIGTFILAILGPLQDLQIEPIYL